METNRGPKDFQYDQVFTPEHGQEKVFEDTNVSQDCFVLVCLFVFFSRGKYMFFLKQKIFVRKSRGKYKVNQSRERKLQIVSRTRSSSVEMLHLVLRDGPLETIWGGGGGEVQKKIHAREN